MKSIDRISFASSSDKQPWRKRIPRSLVPIVLVLSGFLIVTVHQRAVALVRVSSDCIWPTDWPKALDELRNSCKTYGVGTGTQENIYEIVFDDRDQFERLWPVLMSVRTPGSPLRLSAIEEKAEGALLSSAKPTVRVHAPANDGVTIAASESEKKPWDTAQLLQEGKALRPSPPWPAHIISPKGELPEYVQTLEQDGCLTWVPGDRNSLERGFLFRARIDLELVVDGKVIDLNRTPLPSDCTIVDRRFDRRP